MPTKDPAGCAAVESGVPLTTIGDAGAEVLTKNEEMTFLGQLY